MQCVKSLPFLTAEESEIISRTIIAVEDDVKNIDRDIYSYTNSDSLTGRYYCYNFLNNEIIGTILKPKIKKLFGPCIVQCWANIFREGEGINEHKHILESCQDPEFIAVANLFLQGDPTIGTYYEGIKRDNKIGEITVFPTDMKHHVPKNPTKSMRISMAMDLYVDNEKVAKDIRNDTRRFVHIN